MTNIAAAMDRLSDGELLSEVKRLADGERQATARLIASLAALDSRRLYLAEGCTSLFVYCTRVLRLSEHAAYNRIEAARIGRRFPLVLERLTEGAITLTAVALLAPHLTADNHRAALDAARHRSKREVEEIVAALRPRPDVRSTVRKLSAASPSRQTSAAGDRQMGTTVAGSTPSPAVNGSEDRTAAARWRPDAREALPLEPHAAAAACAQPPKPATIVPLAPQRYRVQMTVSAGTYAKLQRAQDLLRGSIPDGDPAAIFDRALTLLVERAERAKFAARAPRTGQRRRSTGPAEGPVRVPAATTTRACRAEAAQPQAIPAAERRPGSRYIPAAIRRAIWDRDGGRCAFVGAEGRCSERAFLEFHHLVPYAAGGASTVENLELRCRSHNDFEASRFFGDDSRHHRQRDRHSNAGVSTRSGTSATRFNGAAVFQPRKLPVADSRM